MSLGNQSVLQTRIYFLSKLVVADKVDAKVASWGKIACKRVFALGFTGHGHSAHTQIKYCAFEKMFSTLARVGEAIQYFATLFRSLVRFLTLCKLGREGRLAMNLTSVSVQSSHMCELLFFVLDPLRTFGSAIITFMGIPPTTCNS